MSSSSSGSSAGCLAMAKTSLTASAISSSVEAGRRPGNRSWSSKPGMRRMAKTAVSIHSRSPHLFGNFDIRIVKFKRIRIFQNRSEGNCCLRAHLFRLARVARDCKQEQSQLIIDDGDAPQPGFCTIGRARCGPVCTPKRHRRSKKFMVAEFSARLILRNAVKSSLATPPGWPFKPSPGRTGGSL